MPKPCSQGFPAVLQAVKAAGLCNRFARTTATKTGPTRINESRGFR
jgi:hypothetical protein